MALKDVERSYGTVEYENVLAVRVCLAQTIANSGQLMKTIVYQSYRTVNVPNWIRTCMQSVRAWADSNGFEYRFFDDSFFDYAPMWYREKAAHQVCPVTDLARLIAARELLGQGYDRTIWVDADMLVFAPERLAVEIKEGFLFCHEVWMYEDAAANVGATHQVNNSITAFCRDNTHLEFFIDACLRLAAHQSKIGKLDVGTAFLTRLAAILPFARLTNVGLLSPPMMVEILTGRPRLICEYANNLRAPLACANLCASLTGQTVQGVVCDDALIERVVVQCLSDRGDSINRHRPQHHGHHGESGRYSNGMPD